ncbi:hypothetical protein GL306_23725, partial [Nocardia seriolae]|nr:hypothetical protein [Nocardia seriolae]
MPGATPSTAPQIADAIVAAAVQSAQRGARGKTPRGDAAVAKRSAGKLAGRGALAPEVA